MKRARKLVNEDWLDPEWPHLESLPTALYRYTTFQRAKEILLTDKLYFSSPTAFNDPFDCKLRPVFNDSRADLERIARMLARRQFSSSSRRERRLKVHDVRPRLRNSRFEEIYSEWKRRVLDQSAILCLTEKCDDILMWAHYADGHAGICLEFKYTTGAPVAGLALPAAYLDTFPQISFGEIFSARDILQFGKLVFLAKSSHWKYEKEWRVIDIATQEVPLYGLRPLPPKSLVAVILGCRMTEEHRKVIHQLVASRSPSPKLYEAVRKDRQFALEIRPVA